MDKINAVLRNAAKGIFARRENFPVEYLSDVRIEKVNNAACCDIWFMTRGCSHDKKGGCTMCNYGCGKGLIVDDEAVIASLSEQLAGIHGEIEETAISPSGSMLDDEEVPPKLREKILELVGGLNCRNFLVESRCDTLTDAKLETLKKYLKNGRIYIETGIESCNDWVLKNCVNKNLSLSDIKRAVEAVHAHGIGMCANIAIGFPFINEYTGIILAVRSIEKAFSIGFDNVVFFPYHVRPGTFLEFLLRNNYYRPYSLHSFCEVLRRLDADVLPRVNISWYRNYYGKGSRKIIASPSSCPECEERMLAALDSYKNKPCIDSLREIDNVECRCRERWRKKIQRQPLQLDVALLNKALAKAYMQ
ncbi:MAG: hypothetical protein IJS28_12760 [Synergistaceae bacterium]|nr:hypothetical protein [Synergistaceae bacterium]